MRKRPCREKKGIELPQLLMIFGAILFVTSFCSFKFIVVVCSLVMIALGIYLQKCS